MSITEADLRQFTGAETFYRHSIMRSVTYTEGVQFLADKAGAYWLVDKIATLQMLPAVRAEEFQLWNLKVDGNSPVLSCTDGDKGDGPVVLHREQIEFTDFPLPEINLFVEGGVILLPSEH